MNFFKSRSLVADEHNVVRGSAAEVAAYIDRDIAAIKRDIKRLDKATGILGRTVHQKLYDALESKHRDECNSSDKKNLGRLVALLEIQAEEWDQFRAVCRNNHSSGRLQEYLQRQKEAATASECPSRGSVSTVDTVEAPDLLIDPISMEILADPVVTPSGITYERSHLLHHLKHNGEFDPITRERLLEGQLYPNLVIKDAVKEYVDNCL